jgi:hypothetical protein
VTVHSIDHSLLWIAPENRQFSSSPAQPFDQYNALSPEPHPLEPLLLEEVACHGGEDAAARLRQELHDAS